MIIESTGYLWKAWASDVLKKKKQQFTEQEVI